MVLNLRVGRETTPSVSTTTNTYSSDDESFFMRTSSRKTTTTKTTMKQTRYQFEQPELTYYLDQNAVLKCNLRNENDQIVWLKDNNRIWGSNAQLNEDKYAVRQEGPERHLIIKNLSLQDTGSYSCHSKLKPTSRVEFKMKVKGIHDKNSYII